MSFGDDTPDPSSLTAPDCRGDWLLGSACGVCKKCRDDAIPALRRFQALVKLYREAGWRPIATARTRGERVAGVWEEPPPIDILAKCWMGGVGRDEFAYRRFTDCRWHDVDRATPNTPEGWTNVAEGWLPVAWMPVPEIPKGYP